MVQQARVTPRQSNPISTVPFQVLSIRSINLSITKLCFLSKRALSDLTPVIELIVSLAPDAIESHERIRDDLRVLQVY